MKTWDEITNTRIETLHPSIRKDVYDFINAAEKHGIFLRVTDAKRSFQQQLDLYAQGRTKPGKIVTWVKVGYHCFGLAFDIVEIIKGKAIWESPNWDRISKLGKMYGFDWGGDFKNSVDKPHFQKTFGFTIDELTKMYQSKETDSNGYIKADSLNKPTKSTITIIGGIVSILLLVLLFYKF